MASSPGQNYGALPARAKSASISMTGMGQDTPDRPVQAMSDDPDQAAEATTSSCGCGLPAVCRAIASSLNAPTLSAAAPASRLAAAVLGGAPLDDAWSLSRFWSGVRVEEKWV